MRPFPLRQPILKAWFAAIALAIAALAPARALAQRPYTPLPGQDPPAAGLPQGSPIPRILPPQPPSVSPGLQLPPAQPATGAVPNATVAISTVAVEGATAYPAGRLQAITGGLTGPAVPLARIEAARLALVGLYRGDGYVLTTVTASIAARGTLRFIVAEGRITDVKLEGDIGPAGTQVLRFLNHLTEVRPVSTADLERWLLLAQDIPGLAVRAVLRPSGAEPGALTLIAQVERQAVSALATADNRAPQVDGPVEGLAIVDLNSFSSLGEKSEFSFYHTEGSSQNFGQASEDFFIGGSGLRGHIYYGTGDAVPSDGLSAIDYYGTTTVFGASATYPVIRTRRETLNVAGYLDAIDSTVNSTLGASKDYLRVARVGIDYAMEDLWLGTERSAINTAVARLSQGIPALGGSTNGNPLAQRPGEAYDFTKFSFELTRTQTLFAPWTDATVALKGRINGQISGDTLPPAEKFFLGGPEFDRGYYAGEVTGDSSFNLTVEAQLNTGFPMTLFDHDVDLGTQFYAFYDHGQAWQNTSAEPNVTLTSEGIGTRVTVTRYTEFDLEGDIRNTRVPQGTAGDVKPIKSDALYWRALMRF